MFQSLREDAEFMDVTLSCDGEQIKAHKVNTLQHKLFEIDKVV